MKIYKKYILFKIEGKSKKSFFFIVLNFLLGDFSKITFSDSCSQ